MDRTMRSSEEKRVNEVTSHNCAIVFDGDGDFGHIETLEAALRPDRMLSSDTLTINIVE